MWRVQFRRSFIEIILALIPHPYDKYSINIQTAFSFARIIVEMCQVITLRLTGIEGVKAENNVWDSHEGINGPECEIIFRLNFLASRKLWLVGVLGMWMKPNG